MKPRAIVLAGPTASGKSSLALELTRHFPVEIVNADSLQIFRHLDIGTAKPTPQELASAPHHMIDVLDPDQEATAGWYSRESRKTLELIWSAKKIPLVVGGSGFYLRALEFPPTAAPTAVESEGSAKDYEYLKAHDSTAAAKIHPNDRYRIGRAVSLLKQGGRPSDMSRAAASNPAPFESLWLGIAVDRAELYEKINRRMERMFAAGLLEETRAVMQRFPGALPRLSRAIGYRQALSILTGKSDLATALTEAQTRSRQYAKRQMTWFRRESRIAWISGKNVASGAGPLIERFLPS